MATHLTNQAVEAYRKMLRLEAKVELADRATLRAIALLDKDEFSDYVRMTAELDEANGDVLAALAHHLPD